jgi:quercetin dioxygenase-like cupin family protein
MRKLGASIVVAAAACCAIAQWRDAHAQKPAPAAQPARPEAAKLKLPPLPPSTESYLVAQLAAAKWTPAQTLDAGIPAGSEVALIGEDPMSTGTTIYLRMKPGYKLPLHWHTHHQYATMIAGKGAWTVDGKRVPSLAGTFVVVPSRAKHEFACDAGAACVFVLRRSGPTDYNWVAK